MHGAAVAVASRAASASCPAGERRDRRSNSRNAGTARLKPAMMTSTSPPPGYTRPSPLAELVMPGVSASAPHPRRRQRGGSAPRPGSAGSSRSSAARARSGVAPLLARGRRTDLRHHARHRHRPLRQPRKAGGIDAGGRNDGSALAHEHPQARGRGLPARSRCSVRRRGGAAPRARCGPTSSGIRRIRPRLGAPHGRYVERSGSRSCMAAQATPRLSRSADAHPAPDPPAPIHRQSRRPEHTAGGAGDIVLGNRSCGRFPRSGSPAEHLNCLAQLLAPAAGAFSSDISRSSPSPGRARAPARLALARLRLTELCQRHRHQLLRLALASAGIDAERPRHPYMGAAKVETA